MEWFRKKFNLLNKNHMDNSEKYKEFNFQKLTPAKVENMKCYQEALDFAFNDPDIKNIAVTGAYSAGKSSIIETYKSLKKDKRFINISLANFEKNNKSEEVVGMTNDEKNRKSQLKENLLEGKILNQIIHQIDFKRIQHTDFKVKREVKRCRVLINTFMITILISLILYNIKFDVWEDIVNDLDKIEILQHTIESDFRLLSIVTCVFIIGFYLYKVVKIQLQGHLFRRIRLNDNEIEMFEKDDDSYFDKYLDEILYLFHNAKIDAVIFEDIDRYNDNSIFNELREINFLINNRVNRKTNKKPIRFLYLIKDDMFISKDRTKFFDFIIPIVPVIDSSNSYEKILEYLESGGILEQFDKTFLQRISLYVDDMRILKNVYNEYVIYSGRLQTAELGLIPDKMLSIIMYKNLFPKDFISLQLNTGFVYNVFDNKSYYIEARIKEINTKIEENIKQIKAIKEEFLNDIDGLDALYLAGSYIVNGKRDTDFGNRIEYIKAIKKANYIVVNNYNGYQQDIKMEFDKFVEDRYYKGRKEIIEQKMNDKLFKLERENLELRYEKSKLNSAKLQELINEYNIDSESIFKYNENLKDDKVFRFEDIINNQYYPLIKYLIRNGYIDETYSDYLTYFYENSLSKRDKIFLRSVTDEITKGYSYKLDDVRTVISYLRASDFEHKETLNFDLLDYLLLNEHQFLKVLLNQIREGILFDFAWGYILRGSNIDKFVKELNNVWKDLCKYLISSVDVSEDQRKTYLIYTFYYSAIEEVKSMNIDDCITTYISTNKDFLEIYEPHIDLIIEKFIQLNVKFEDINYDKAGKDLFYEVYKNNLYCINFNMITLILNKVYKIPYGEDLKKKNYTLISSRPNEPLLQYINNNMDKYIKVALDNLEYGICDSEDSVAFILNNKDIEQDDKLIYIENLSIVISDLCKVDSNYWEDLIKNNNVEYSTHNALEYYFYYSGSIDSTLVDYLNSSPNKIKFSYEYIKENYEENDVTEFFLDVIKNQELTSEKYKMILEGYEHQINEFEIDEIEDDKLKILIHLNIIGMTKKNIEFIRSKYPNSVISFICSDIQKYIDCLDEEILNEHEILELLEEPAISDKFKISLIEKYPHNISVIGSNYTEDVQAFIVQNKLDDNDLVPLIKNYHESSEFIQVVIQEACIAKVKDICDKKLILPHSLIDNIISNEKVENYYKKIIIYNNLDKLNFEKVKEYLLKARFNDFVDLLEGKRPKITKTKEHHDLLEYFKNKGWISSYREDTNDPNFYQTFGNRRGKQKRKLLADVLL